MIAEDQVEAALSQQLLRYGATPSRFCLIALLLEQARQQHAEVLVVVQHEDSSVGHVRAVQMLKPNWRSDPKMACRLSGLGTKVSAPAAVAFSASVSTALMAMHTAPGDRDLMSGMSE